MTLRAYAKINLGLRILRKRPDLYHDIETVFHQINLYDELELVQSDEGIEFFTDSSDVPTDSRNLCVRAAQLLRDLSGSRIGVEIKLRKRIPIGSGLGGGSSNAAAVLKGLVRIWDLDINKEELVLLAGTLGADVPFFIEGGSAYATGRGEKLEAMEMEVPFTILVISPSVQVSTAWAYTHCTPRANSKEEILRDVLLKNLNDPGALTSRIQNDFETVVFPSFPEVEETKRALERGGADFALMSGSGSSVFGFFHDAKRAEKLREDLSSSYHTSLTEPFFKPERTQLPR